MAAGGLFTAAALAGCSAGDDGGETGDGDDGTSDGSDGGTGGATGAFRLLISDQPVAIDEFDSLDVTFESARIYRGEGMDGGDASDDGDDGDAGNLSAENGDPGNETAEDGDAGNQSDENGDEDSEDDDSSDDGLGFVELDLDGATVDLTRVIGERAIGVFEGDLEEGTYSSIELSTEDVAGVVDGESVDVMIPSEKLRIVKPFEVAAGEELSFVFDITVVRKGPSGGYNLLPVIGESGVVGRDIEVEEIDRSDDDGNDIEEDEEGDAMSASETDGDAENGNGGKSDGVDQENRPDRQDESS